ncbi:MAG: SEC-C metal-binding domain-containing protein [Alphaproteobacteria bacterium]|nr:SEC-C metal-binding domain-containing protein [Alphaproteobacteria bacterium]
MIHKRGLPFVRGTKIRRNEKCPCGSGKKYKYCHGNSTTSSTLPLNTDSYEKEFQQQFREIQAKQKLQQDMQGLGRPIISFVSHGYRLVAVGNTLHWSKNWKTFHDFLLYYIKKAMGEDWGNVELKKPYEQRHPVLQWYHQVCLYQQATIKVPGHVSSAPMTGAVEAYIQLAYNLYLLAHNIELQKRLLERLKNLESFPGAYYEAYVFATLIKAGFEIVFENENDGNSTHCECVATCVATGNKYSVEAKAIRRFGSMGATENTTTKALRGSVRDQLYKALSKTAPYPRIIFVDLNVCEKTPENIPTWMHDAINAAKEAEEDLTIKGKTAPSAYIMLTNHPHHYYLQEMHYGTIVASLGFKIPDFGHGKQYPSLRAAHAAMKKHADINGLIKSIKTHYEIPSTFEAELPEFVFGDPALPRMKIGHRYSVPNANGDFVAGELETACVLGSAKKIYGTFHLEGTGQRIVATCPISDEELVAYKKHPDTFFGIIQPQGKKLEEPYELFEWMLESYKNTSKEKLLEFMKEHHDFENLRSMPQQDLAETYCERCTYAIVNQRSG